MVSWARRFALVGVSVLIPVAFQLYRSRRRRLEVVATWEEIFAAPEGPTAQRWEGFQPLPWDDAEEKAGRTAALMTEAEKFALLKGTGWGSDNTFFDPNVGFYVGNIPAIPRLGVPPLKMHDAASGFRPTSDVFPGTVTCYPSMLAIAATWDEQVMEEVATAIAVEYRGKGANVLLGPSIQVHRTAWGGRNAEYVSGDDPYLGSRLTGPFVRAVQREGVMATIKHFAFNEQETLRHNESSVVDRKTAWELYYPPFQAAVAAGVGAVMCSYNKVQGTHACGNGELLKGDLKGEMRFPGFVMSDWGATHGSGYIERGLDMEMPGSQFLRDELLTDVGPDVVREAAFRVLTSIYRLRLDEDPGCTPPCSRDRASVPRTKAHLKLAGEAAAASVVLLKNDGVLPISRDRVKRILVLGAAASALDSPLDSTASRWSGSYYAGGGSGHVAAPKVVTPLQGIERRAAKAGIAVDAATAIGDELPEATRRAKAADVAVIVAATTAEEGADRRGLALDQGADELIFAIADIVPTVVLLETPGAVLTPWRDKVSATACLFLGGEAAGTAWAAVLFGDRSPSGKLPITLPASEEDTVEPGAAPRVVYAEGLLTSYRSPGTRAAFPFGHGLSYTKFKVEEPWQWTDGCIAVACVRAVVRNVGHAAGRETLQAYLEFERSTNEPKYVLRGFHKTRELGPGQTDEVLFTFTSRDMSTYHAEDARWVQESHVLVHIGVSSAEVLHVVPVHAKNGRPSRASAA